MGEVIQVWSLEKLERQAREAVQRAWKTKKAKDYEIADRLFARWRRLRRNTPDRLRLDLQFRDSPS